MEKLTETVHMEKEEPEVVWVEQSGTNLQPEESCSKLKEDKNNLETKPELPIVYSKQYGVHFCKLEKLHPFDSHKGKNIIRILKEEQVVEGKFYEPEEITKEQLLRVHTPKYLRSLKWSYNVAQIAELPFLILMPNCILQSGYLRPMRYQTAGSIMAGKLALQYGWAINLGGGFHHCCSVSGGGFCVYADITLLIQTIFDEDGVRNVLIVDLDAHQGNGHERDFIENPHVYIMDMYNMHVYPRDHDAKTGISYAVELMPQTKNTEYLKKLKTGLSNVLNEFEPALVVYNAGTDILKGDPLGNLSITPEGVIDRDQIVFETFRSRNIPIVMLLSGGYLKLSAKVIADSIANLKKRGLLQINK